MAKLKLRDWSLHVFLSLSLVGISNCKKEEKEETIIAKVGESSLTLDDLRESFPPEFEQIVSREQYLDFIKRWIDEEVLYQAALKQEVDQEEKVKRKLLQTQRKIIVEEFMQNLNSSEDYSPDETAMTQYYEIHKEDFRRTEQDARFAILRVDALEKATDTRKKISTNNFLAIARQKSLDPVPESMEAIPFKRVNSVDSCIRGTVNSLKPGDLSQPITCKEGFILVRMFDKQSSGTLLPYPEAKVEIRNVLAYERKGKLLESRIQKFKEEFPITYNMERIPGHEPQTNSDALEKSDSLTSSDADLENHDPDAAPVQKNSTATMKELDGSVQTEEKVSPKPRVRVPVRPAMIETPSISSESIPSPSTSPSITPNGANGTVP